MPCTGLCDRGAGFTSSVQIMPRQGRWRSLSDRAKPGKRRIGEWIACSLCRSRPDPRASVTPLALRQPGVARSPWQSRPCPTMSAGSAKSSHCREPVTDRRPASIGPLASTRRGYKDAPPAAPGSPAQSPSAPSGRETTWRAVDVRSILAAGAPDPRPAGAARNLAEVLDFSRPPNLAAPRYDVPPFAGLPCPVGGFADYEDWRALRDVALRSGWSLPA